MLISPRSDMVLSSSMDVKDFSLRHLRSHRGASREASWAKEHPPMVQPTKGLNESQPISLISFIFRHLGGLLSPSGVGASVSKRIYFYRHSWDESGFTSMSHLYRGENSSRAFM